MHITQVQYVHESVDVEYILFILLYAEEKSVRIFYKLNRITGYFCPLICFCIVGIFLCKDHSLLL